MPSPFSGMNPYLEHPAFWPGVHLLLIAALSDFLSPQLRPKYRVAVETRIYRTSGEFLRVGIPDVTIKRSVTTSRSTESNLAVANSPSQPLTVAVPMPEIIRRGYLEPTFRTSICRIEDYK